VDNVHDNDITFITASSTVDTGSLREINASELVGIYLTNIHPVATPRRV
jgi:hypothetical protein